jgi:hypothetical protein
VLRLRQASGVEVGSGCRCAAKHLQVYLQMPRGDDMTFTVTLEIQTLDHKDPNEWDWNAILEDLVWSVQVRKEGA